MLSYIIGFLVQAVLFYGIMTTLQDHLHYSSSIFYCLAKIPLTYRSFCTLFVSPTIDALCICSFCQLFFVTKLEAVQEVQGIFTNTLVVVAGESVSPFVPVLALC